MSKDIPTFESEDEEREFWATHDSTEYVDWDKASPVCFPRLKPSARSIQEHLGCNGNASPLEGGEAAPTME